MNKSSAPTNIASSQDAKASSIKNLKGSCTSIAAGHDGSLQEDDNDEETLLDDGKYVDTSSGGSDNNNNKTAVTPANADDDDDDQHHKVIENLKQKQSTSANKKFQRLFGGKIKESNERLVSVFRCALLRNNKRLLLQGMLYVTRKHFAFHSNIFGFQTLEFERWADIKEIKKENIALLFPTAISFTTHSDKKYFFASFLYRNQAFKILTKVWHHHSHHPCEDQSSALNLTGIETDLNNNNNHLNSHSSSEKTNSASNLGDTQEPPSRASSTSLSSSSLESIEVNETSDELFVDSCQVDDDAFRLEEEEDSSDMITDKSSLIETPDYVVAKPESASLASKMTSSLANLAQSLVYFFVLNRVNMFFFDKIQLFIRYLFINRSFNQSFDHSQNRARAAAGPEHSLHSSNHKSSSSSSMMSATFLSSRFISIKSLRIYYSELLIIVTFLVVVLVLYVYIFLILIKVNTIETKLADLYEKLKSF